MSISVNTIFLNNEIKKINFHSPVKAWQKNFFLKKNHLLQTLSLLLSLVRPHYSLHHSSLLIIVLITATKGNE